MTAPRTFALLLTLSLCASFQRSVSAGDPPPPVINTVILTNGQKRISWTPYPATFQYKVLHAGDLSQSFVEATNGNLSGFDWTAPLDNGIGFNRLQAVPLSANDLLVANVLNRLAYGPTPDELERVRAMGPDNYIEEQLAPEGINENLPIDDVTTNFGSGWQYFTATGTASFTNRSATVISSPSSRPTIGWYPPTTPRPPSPPIRVIRVALHCMLSPAAAARPRAHRFGSPSKVR